MRKYILAVILGLLIAWYSKPIVLGEYVYHLRYGRYPAVVLWEPGMPLHPGQTAILGKPTSIEKNLDGTTTVKWE